jgi:hypothetical protein
MKYVLGPAGSNSCPHATWFVRDTTECRTAYTYLSGLPSVSPVNDGIDYQHNWGIGRPTGCFLHLGNRNVHFNPGSGGNSLGNDQPICKRNNDRFAFGSTDSGSVCPWGYTAVTTLDSCRAALKATERSPDGKMLVGHDGSARRFVVVHNIDEIGNGNDWGTSKLPGCFTYQGSSSIIQFRFNLGSGDRSPTWHQYTRQVCELAPPHEQALYEGLSITGRGASTNDPPIRALSVPVAYDHKTYCLDTLGGGRGSGGTIYGTIGQHEYCTDNGNNGVTCNKPKCGPNERYHVYNHGNYFTIRGGQNLKYCKSGGGDKIQCASNEVKNWEQFTEILYSRASAGAFPASLYVQVKHGSRSWYMYYDKVNNLMKWASSAHIPQQWAAQEVSCYYHSESCPCRMYECLGPRCCL